MKMHYLILSMFLFFAKVNSQGPITSGSCNFALIDVCLTPIYLEPGSLLEQPIPYEKLTSICRNLIKAKNCFNEKAKNCFKSELVKQLTNIDIVDYICTDEGKNGLKRAVICSTTPSFYESFSECNKKISSLMTADASIIGNICKQNNALYSCYVHSYKICNLESFVTTFYKKLQGPQLEAYGCDLDFRNWDTKVYSRCNVSKLSECMSSSLTPDIQQFFGNPLNFQMQRATPYQVNKACSAVDAIINCVTYNARCDMTIPSVLVSISLTSAYDYLCKIDRAGNDKLTSCFQKNPSMFDYCMKSLPSDCSSFLALQKCLTDTNVKTCGSSSTIDNYIYKIYQPIFNLTVGGCNLFPPAKGLTLANEADGKIQSIFLTFLISILIYNV